MLLGNLWDAESVSQVIKYWHCGSKALLQWNIPKHWFVMSWETSIIRVWWPGIETLSYYRVEEKQSLLPFVISYFLCSTLTLGCFFGFDLHLSDFVSYKVQKFQNYCIIQKNLTPYSKPNSSGILLQNSWFYILQAGSWRAFLLLEERMIGAGISVVSFSSCCHAKLLSTNYSERPGVAEKRFIWIFFSEPSSKRLWDITEEAAAWSLPVTVGFYVRCLIRFRHIFMLSYTRVVFKNVTNIKNNLHLLCFIADTIASASPVCASKQKVKPKTFGLNCSDLLRLACELFCLGWSDREKLFAI